MVSVIWEIIILLLTAGAVQVIVQFLLRHRELDMEGIIQKGAIMEEGITDNGYFVQAAAEAAALLLQNDI